MFIKSSKITIEGILTSKIINLNVIEKIINIKNVKIKKNAD